MNDHMEGTCGCGNRIVRHPDGTIAYIAGGGGGGLAPAGVDAAGGGASGRVLGFACHCGAPLDEKGRCTKTGVFYRSTGRMDGRAASGEPIYCAECSRAHAELDAAGVTPSSRYERDVPPVHERIRMLVKHKEGDE